MRVLVTGGAGFIGSHTVDLLIEKGFDVRIFDNLEFQVHEGKRPNHLNENVEFITGDVTKKKQWEKVLKDVQAVIHLAAMVGIGQSMYQPFKYLLTNTTGTALMYEVLINNKNLRKNIEKIVVASSKSIYGEGAYLCKTDGTVYPGARLISQLEKKDWEVRCPRCNEYVKPIGITEEKPVQNISIYALSKYDTERIAINFGNVLGITSVAFRYFNVYGPRQSLSNPYTGVAAIFMSRIKNNNNPIINEDGKQMRDFIYVDDIAKVNLLALDKAKNTDVYNVGTGVPVTIEQIARTLIEIYGSKVLPVIRNQYRAGDNRHDFSDISKIKKDLGFEPKWTLKKGFEKLVEWSKTQDAKDKFEQAENERIRMLGG